MNLATAILTGHNFCQNNVLQIPTAWNFHSSTMCVTCSHVVTVHYHLFTNTDLLTCEVCKKFAHFSLFHPCTTTLQVVMLLYTLWCYCTCIAIVNSDYIWISCGLLFMRIGIAQYVEGVTSGIYRSHVYLNVYCKWSHNWSKIQTENSKTKCMWDTKRSYVSLMLW